jgi:diacylglycerol O-acyltransferase
MRPRVERLGAGDLAVLWAEEPATPFHIGLAGLLEPGRLVDERGRPRLQELRAAVDARLARAPELRRRIRWTGFGEGRPAVVDDHDFAIARHVSAVDLGGVDELAFWSWCANQTLPPLDREHPLWRVTLATGLAGGQVGVLIVLHHALADGMAGIALAGRLLDLAPDTGAVPRPWRAAPAPGPLALAVDAVVGRLAAVGAALRRLPDAPRAIRVAGRDAAATRAALAQAAPATSLDHPVGPGRRLAVIRRPLEQVKWAGRAHGATVNDVLLAAVAGGLHQLLAARGEPIEGLELRVSVPVGAPGRARNAGGSTPPGPAAPRRAAGPRRPAGPHRRRHPGRQGRPGPPLPGGAGLPAAADQPAPAGHPLAAPSRRRQGQPVRHQRPRPAPAAVAGRGVPADRGADRAPGRRRPGGRGGAVVCR